MINSVLVPLKSGSSGWQDSNLRPPAPKAGAITGLRYTPSGVNSNISSTKFQIVKSLHQVAREPGEACPEGSRRTTPLE